MTHPAAIALDRDGYVQEYRGWAITWDYGHYTATGPDYDASYEGEEDGWVDNGHRVSARTRDGLIEEIDAWFEEQANVAS